MYTVIETPHFSKLAADYWDEDERVEFAAWISLNPKAGNVVSGSGGVRKVRWSRPGAGKRGGVRVIYYNRLAAGHIWLLTLYAKGVRGNIPPHVLRALKEMIDDE